MVNGSFISRNTFFIDSVLCTGGFSIIEDGEFGQAGRSDESSRMLLSAFAATVDAADIQDADDTAAAETGEFEVRCSSQRHIACFALLNMTFAEAANVANERVFVPDFDDDRLDTICR